MVRWIVVAAGCVTLGSCQSTPRAPVFTDSEPVTLTAAQTAKVQQGIKDLLKDPYSARFEKTVARRATSATNGERAVFVCGFVNARNSYGGYTGNKPYIAGYTTDFTRLIGQVLDDSEGLENIYSRCREAAGIELR